MPNQPPSDRTRAKGGHPSPEFWILNSGFSPNYAKQTQFPHTKCPACIELACPACPEPVERSLSRVSRVHPPKNAKQTQFTMPQASCQLRAATYYAKQTQSTVPPPGHPPKNAKQTQSQPHCHPERQAAERSAAAQSRGTCSITIAEGDSTQKGARTPPKIRNKPNSPFTRLAESDSTTQYTIYNIQFTIPYPPPIYKPKNAKQTQFRPRRLIRRPVLQGRKSMLDKGSIFVYKVVNKGLMEVLGGRSSVVEHQLPKREIRFYSALNPCKHSTYKPEFFLFYEFDKNSTHYTLSSDCSHIHDIVVLYAGSTLG